MINNVAGIVASGRRGIDECKRGTVKRKGIDQARRRFADCVKELATNAPAAVARTNAEVNWRGNFGQLARVQAQLRAVRAVARNEEQRLGVVGTAHQGS